MQLINKLAWFISLQRSLQLWKFRTYPCKKGLITSQLPESDPFKTLYGLHIREKIKQSVTFLNLDCIKTLAFFQKFQN